MTPADVLTAVAAVGATITARGGSLVLTPASAVPPSLVPLLRQHKFDLLSILAETNSPWHWPAEWVEQWRERVAIMIVDGRLPEAEAEIRAAEDVAEMMRLPCRTF
jgi:hypothetical protein